MTQRSDKHILKNGMVILGNPMENVESAAFTFWIPSGASRLPKGCCGAGAVIADWLFRGAGEKNTRELIDAVDGLGLHRSSLVTSSHITLGAALEAGNLTKAIQLYADIILNPKLDPEQFELSRELAINEVIGLNDDPRQDVMLKLYERFYPSGLGLPAMGKLDELKSLDVEKTAAIVKSNFNLSQTIFAIAGKYDFNALCSLLEDLFDSPQPDYDPGITAGAKGDKYLHRHNDGAQVHIGLMTPTVPPSSKDYYNAMTSVSVLSGGMSSRLFTEVREKRGLCYAIGAQYHTLKSVSGISCYAGTTPEKAQETIDVIIAEFDRLSDGITENELQRAKVGLKSTLIMQSESSSARATGIAGDHYLLGRVRSLDEIKDKLEQTSIDSVLSFLQNNRFEDYTVVTIGPKEINTP